MISEKSKNNCVLILLATIVAIVSVGGQLTRGTGSVVGQNKVICLYNSSSFTREGWLSFW